MLLEVLAHALMNFSDVRRLSHSERRFLRLGVDRRPVNCSILEKMDSERDPAINLVRDSIVCFASAGGIFANPLWAENKPFLLGSDNRTLTLSIPLIAVLYGCRWIGSIRRRIRSGGRERSIGEMNLFSNLSFVCP